MRVAILALALASCGAGPRQFVTRQGIHVINLTSAEGLKKPTEQITEAVIQHCRGRRAVKGLRLSFVPEVIQCRIHKECPEGGHTLVDTTCAGVYYPSSGQAVVWLAEGQGLAETSLAHELTHRIQNDLTGDVDYHHSDPHYWGPEGCLARARSLSLRICE